MPPFLPLITKIHGCFPMMNSTSSCSLPQAYLLLEVMRYSYERKDALWLGLIYVFAFLIADILQNVFFLCVFSITHIAGKCHLSLVHVYTVLHFILFIYAHFFSHHVYTAPWITDTIIDRWEFQSLAFSGGLANYTILATKSLFINSFIYMNTCVRNTSIRFIIMADFWSFTLRLSVFELTYPNIFDKLWGVE